MHRTFLHRLTTKEAADYLGYSESTLRHWRKGEKAWRPGLGPPRGWFPPRGRRRPPTPSARRLSPWRRRPVRLPQRLVQRMRRLHRLRSTANTRTHPSLQGL